GLTNKEIAGMLQISIDGVKYHVANALSKRGGAGKQESTAAVVSCSIGKCSGG
ncbi:MAG: DNA-binding CsgD family transcriptional regulator, partial [Candidatus Azotimanducaceae bacterium]